MRTLGTHIELVKRLEREERLHRKYVPMVRLAFHALTPPRALRPGGVTEAERQNAEPPRLYPYGHPWVTLSATLRGTFASDTSQERPMALHT